MTRKQFEEKAIRTVERGLQIPSGWWGLYGDVQSPNGVRVRCSGFQIWTVSVHGKRVSRHSTRVAAIAKGKSLA